MVFSSLSIDLYSRVTGMVDALPARHCLINPGILWKLLVFMKKPTNKYELCLNLCASIFLSAKPATG